jgi:hypothetical protein
MSIYESSTESNNQAGVAGVQTSTALPRAIETKNEGIGWLGRSLAQLDEVLQAYPQQLHDMLLPLPSDWGEEEYTRFTTMFKILLAQYEIPSPLLLLSIRDFFWRNSSWKGHDSCEIR